jgi:DNA-binding NarL/FixJ family response regulator
MGTQRPSHSVAVVTMDGEPAAGIADLLTGAGLRVSVLGSAEEVEGPRVSGLDADVVVFVCEALEARDLARIARLSERLRADRRVVISAREPRSHVLRRAVRSAVEGVVLADDCERALVPTIHAVAARQVVVPALKRQRLETPMLSHRERQILAMAVEGCTNDEIARRLYLATSTVKTHLSAVFGKLEVKSRKEAAAVIHDLAFAGEPELALPIADGGRARAPR